MSLRFLDGLSNDDIAAGVLVAFCAGLVLGYLVFTVREALS